MFTTAKILYSIQLMCDMQKRLELNFWIIHRLCSRVILNWKIWMILNFKFDRFSISHPSFSRTLFVNIYLQTRNVFRRTARFRIIYQNPLDTSFSRRISECLFFLLLRQQIVLDVKEKCGTGIRTIFIRWNTNFQWKSFLGYLFRYLNEQWVY